MGQTIAEKIISAHAGKPVRAGELCVVEVDGALASDATAPFAIQAFREMGGARLFNPERLVLVIDHASPAPNERVANLHAQMRAFARETGCRLYDIGAGIIHHVMIDGDHVRPGELILGADSHTCTYGALNAFASGVGSTDLAGIMLTGKTWLKTPATIRVEFTGRLPFGVDAKDLILETVGALSVSGAAYKAVEYGGEAIRDFTLSQRITLANMTVEMGGKAGLVDPAGLTLPYEFEPTFADADAVYERRLAIDASSLTPRVSFPHAPDQVRGVEEAEGVKIDVAFIGACTNTRIEDLRIAAAILKGRKVAPGVRLLVAPASRQVMLEAMRDGALEILTEAGAALLTTGCGPCVGTHLGVPGDGEVVISAANRNFQGRMGNRNAQVYLASPACVAASALRGEITNPAKVAPRERES